MLTFLGSKGQVWASKGAPWNAVSESVENRITQYTAVKRAGVPLVVINNL